MNDCVGDLVLDCLFSLNSETKYAILQTCCFQNGFCNLIYGPSGHLQDIGKLDDGVCWLMLSNYYDLVQYSNKDIEKYLKQ